jgi:hypothetical protein
MLHELNAAPLAAMTPADVATLATKMGAAYDATTGYYRTTDVADAELEARTTDAGRLERIQATPTAALDWDDLRRLADADPDLATAAWERCKAEALAELRSGHRAAEAMETSIGQSPFERARFLALRNALVIDWQPRGAMEELLLDQLAAWYTRWLYWQNVEVWRSTYECRKPKQPDSKWELPRVTEAAATDAAMAMADRCNRGYLRTMRALVALRRSPITVNAQQVNVGAQQVNVSG